MNFLNEEIKNHQAKDTPFQRGYRIAAKRAREAFEQLDGPEKPVVPQYVADWYEGHKDNLEWHLGQLGLDMMNKVYDGTEMYDWLKNSDNKPFETLVNMHQFDYEVEKEKLYTVEIPNPNGGTYLALCKDVDGKLFFDAFFSEEWKTFGKCKLTESEIKEGFAWAWQFAVEVKE